MIQTAIQLKAKIRNMSGGDSLKAQTLIRNYMMERFLERCSISEYRNHFILKGGMFIASYVGNLEWDEVFFKTENLAEILQII